MKSKKSILVFSIVLILVLATSLIIGCKAPETTPPPSGGEQPTAEVKTLPIGALFSVTGFFSVREVPDYNQTLIMADYINENGGITVKGQKYNVEIVLEDCKTSMDGVTAAANKLVFDKGIKFTLGPTAFFAAAAGPVCDPNKVLRCITWCVHTPGELDSSTPYAFLASNASAIYSTALVNYVREHFPNVKKVAVVTVDDGAIPYVIPIAEDLLNRNGIQIVGDVISYPNEMQDMSPIVAKVNAIKDADAMYMQNGLGPHFGGIVKGLYETGNHMPIFGALPTLLNEVVAIAGKEASQNVITTAYTPTDPALPAVAQEIIKRTFAKYGNDYPLLLTGADSLWVLKEMIEKADSLDPEVVKATWESSDKAQTIFGEACVCGDKTFGIHHHVVAAPQGLQFMDKDGNIMGALVDVGCIP
jgi:ABC-type branched-subunit amino acid transport system substrate-binding protein